MALRFDLLTLKLFAAVVEEGSIAGAAGRERLAASAISKRISDLETALGLPLLMRMRRGVRPTEVGRALLHHARSILREVGELDSELAGYASGTSGYVRILTNETCIFSFLPEELGEFLKRNPHIKVELKVAVSAVIVQAIADNVADVGIFTGAAPASDVTVLPYHSDSLAAVVPVGHPLLRRRKVKLIDLLEHDLIEQERRSSIELFVLAAAARLGRPVRVRVRVESFDAMCRMVAVGLGIGIIPRPFPDHLGRSLGIRALQLDEPWAVREHRICVRDLPSASGPVRHLVAHLVQSAGHAAPCQPSRSATAAGEN